MDRPFGGVFFHAQAELLHAVRQLVELAARQDVGQTGGLNLSRQAAGVLGQEAERSAYPGAAARRRELPAQDPQQGRLAGAVAADQSDLVAGAHREGRLHEGEAPADFHAQVAGLEHEFHDGRFGGLGACN